MKLPDFSFPLLAVARGRSGYFCCYFVLPSTVPTSQLLVHRCHRFVGQPLSPGTWLIPAAFAAKSTRGHPSIPQAVTLLILQLDRILGFSTNFKEVSISFCFKLVLLRKSCQESGLRAFFVILLCVTGTSSSLILIQSYVRGTPKV